MPLAALFLLRGTQFSNFIIFQIRLHLSTYLERVGNYESNNEPQRTMSRVAFNYEYRNLVKISLRRRYRNRIFLSFSFFPFPGGERISFWMKQEFLLSSSLNFNGIFLSIEKDCSSLTERRSSRWDFCLFESVERDSRSFSEREFA